MAIINQSTVVLILIISYLVGLDLFGRSKIDTQDTSLNVVSVCSLLALEKSPPKHYLISRIIYLLIMFAYLVQNSKGYEIVVLDGASFYCLKMPVNLIQYRGAVGAFNTRKSIFQRSRKRYSSLNYVNINSFQIYSPSTFILFVFLFLGLKYDGHKNLYEIFCLFSFSNGCFAKHFFLVANSLSIVKWRRRNKSRSYTHS